MSIRLQLPKVTDLKPRITVIGVGGAGGNAINNMIAAGLEGVDFVVANTDAQALATSSAENRLQLGVNLTEGMGAGSKPEIGEAAAEEAIDDIRTMIAGSHMLFIAAGMGGGTGTGAAAVIARVARELGILTVAVVTKPFHFEGVRRMRIAESGIIELKGAVDTLIVIPNQNLFRIANEQTTFAEAFVLADQVLYSGIACIVDLIIKEGLINLDLADVKTVLAGMGPAMMGTGEASGADRALLAAEEAIHNPLLDDMSLKGAKGLLVSIIGGNDLTLYEVDAAASRVRKEVDPEANIIVGATFDEALGDRIRVSIVASGMLLDQSATPVPPSPFANLQGVPTQPVTGKAPPPLPSRPPAAKVDHDQLERRLSDALEPGSGHTAQFDGALGANSARVAATATPDRKADGVHRSNDITIEARLPEFTGQVAAQPQPRGLPDGESGYQQSTDNRGTPRPQPHRMPELSDFPPIAQHEFRARTEAQAAHTPPPRPSFGHAPRVAVAETKKPSLLQRITGTKRVRAANAGAAAELEQDAELPSFLGRRFK